jgi:pyridoxal phosphate enzyme (YggS family)
VTGSNVDAGRRAQLATRLAALEQRLAAACAEAGRARAELTLIAVAKTWPPADVRAVVDLGVREVGENRDQEAAPKAAALSDADVRWHFIGRLQTNKARSVATYAEVVHSVDRRSLVDALARACAGRSRALRCLVQVSLDLDSRRGGAPPAEVPALADLIEAADGLALGGVMAMAPPATEPDVAFARLARVAQALRAGHPQATVISAGMSADLEAAIRHGATHLRVGGALFGPRKGSVR